jgi:hypothetical protein
MATENCQELNFCCCCIFVVVAAAPANCDANKD